MKKQHAMPAPRRTGLQQPGFFLGVRTRGAMAGSACAALLLVAGCQTRPEFRPLTSDAPPPPVFVTVPADEVCQAVQARYALGRALDPALLEEMRTRTGSKSARTSPAGTPLPLPADPARLNVDVDPQGLVVAARCG
jgi:hypothetical protein